MEVTLNSGPFAQGETTLDRGAAAGSAVEEPRTKGKTKGRKRKGGQIP